jgi:prevent-host-death family protein
MSKKQKIVGARELKTRLGTYLARVRAGEIILVTDRGKPVAELRPIEPPADSQEEALRRMETEGLITRGKHRRRLTPFEPIELPPGVSASDLILRERDEGF